MVEIGISKSAADFNGLKWVRDLWGAEPRWTIRLNMESIQEVAKSTMPVSLHSTIKFLGRGAFNKLYIVKNYRNIVVVRVTLPVDPKWKTSSEVATLEWIRKMTFLPVPKVLAYDTDRRNPIGFEYIIMEKIRGKPLAKVWRDIDFDAKKNLVHDLAVFCAQTFQRRTNGIGNLFPHREGNMERLMIGRIVSAAFLWEDHIHRDVDRGPFRSSKEWLSARLALAEINCQRSLIHLKKLKNSDEDKKSIAEDESDEDGDESEEGVNESEEEEYKHYGPFDLRDEEEYEGYVTLDLQDEDRQGDQGDQKSIPDLIENSNVTGLNNDTAKIQGQLEDQEGSPSLDRSTAEGDLEEIEKTMLIISKLRNRMNEFFPVQDQGAEATMIFHDDLSRHNILVDKKGVLTGVVDWECVSVLPLWIACQFPPVLQGKRHDLRPMKGAYQRDENGEVAELYWEHLEDYELTQLRRIFLENMRLLEPKWVEIFESSQDQRDFDLAVTSCGDPFLIRRTCNWLEDMDSGVENFQGLEERIYNASL